MEVELHIFVTSLQDSNEWLSFIPSPLFSRWNSLQIPTEQEAAREAGGGGAPEPVAPRWEKILGFSETPNSRFPGHPVRMLVAILKRYAGICQERFKGNRHNLRVQVLGQGLNDTVTCCGVN